MRIGDEQVAQGVHPHTLKAGEAGARRGTAVAGEAQRGIAHHDGDDACGGVHPADAVVVRIGDVQVARGIYRHTARTRQAGAGGRAAVAGKAMCATARHGGDDAFGGLHAADAAVARIGDEQVARGVHRHTLGEAQAGGGGGAAVAGEAPGAGARHGGDDPTGPVHPADAVVELIGDVQVARGVHRHIGGDAQAGAGGRATVPGEARGAGARHGGDDACGGVHPADAAVARIGDEQVARGVHCDTTREA